MLKKTNVLWKREGGRVYISSAKGTYVINKKGSFVWDMLGREEEGKIIELYEKKYGPGEKEGAIKLINKLKSLDFVEV